MSRFPKMWPVGGHAEGEAKVRQLQKLGPRWLRASGPGWVAEKQNTLSNVKHEGGTRYLTWPVLRDPAPAGLPPYPTWVGLDAIGKMRKSGVIDADGVNTAALWPEQSCGVGAGKVLVTVADFRRNMTTMKFPYTVYAVDQGGRVTDTPVATFEYDTNTTRGHVAGARVGEKRCAGIQYRNTYIDIEQTGSGYITSHKTIYELDTNATTSPGGRVFRKTPNQLLHYGIEGVGTVDDATFRIRGRTANGRGDGWSVFDEPFFAGLFTINVSETFDVDKGIQTVARFVEGSMQASPIAGGEILMAVRAMNVRRVGHVGQYVAFDIANTNLETSPNWGSATPPNPTSGLTLLRGTPGALSLAGRVKLTGRAIEPRSLAVSGDVFVLLITESEFDRFDYGPASQAILTNGKLYTENAALLYSENAGETWQFQYLPTSGPFFGLLSVAADGKFRLPMRIVIDGEHRWGVFKFTKPSTGLVMEKWYPAERVTEYTGCVFDPARSGRGANPLPGTPWVCDDRLSDPGL